MLVCPASIIRDGTLEKLWEGGEGGGGVDPKKYSCHGLKKNSYKEFDNEKKIPSPITFLMVRP